MCRNYVWFECFEEVFVCSYSCWHYIYRHSRKQYGTPKVCSVPCAMCSTINNLDKTFIHPSQNGRLFSNVLVACSYLRQGMMTKRSTHAFKRVMVTVKDMTGGEVLYE